MGKLNVTVLRYLTDDDFRVLTAIEMGMKNHELVPGPLAAALANLRAGGVHKLLRDLCKNRLLSYERGLRYDGYRLTNSGYDYLALKVLAARGAIQGFGSQIGVGKESNIYIVADQDGNELCLKLHRLGRICFRNLKEKRDYHGHSRQRTSWLYLSKISATKEFRFMEALWNKGFPVPQPLDHNRHCVLMQLIQGHPLSRVCELERDRVEQLYEQLMSLILRLASYGVIHGDFNEFNIMLTDEGDPVIIDFPQMVSLSHLNAKTFFERDVNCIRQFFKRRFGYESELFPTFEDIEREECLDVELAASGFTREMDDALLQGLGINAVEEEGDTEEEEEEEGTERSEGTRGEECGRVRGEKSRGDRSGGRGDEESAEVGQLTEMLEEQTITDVAKPRRKVHLSVMDFVLSQQVNMEKHLYGVENGEEKCISDSEPLSTNLVLASDEKSDEKECHFERCSVGTMSIASSTIPPEMIRSRLKKELFRKEKKERRQRAVAKGEASAVTRQRRDNNHTIRDSSGVWGWE